MTMNQALLALKKALRSPEVLEAIALAEAEPAAASSLRLLRVVKTAEAVLCEAWEGRP